MQIIKPKTTKQNIVVQELDKELLIYDLSDNKAYCLNETSALVYQLSDGKKTVGEISDLMSVKLKTLVSEVFVWLALNELNRDGLIENTDDLNEYFSKMNRREVVKKIGFASMIALPIVSSIIAPNAAMAQSTNVCGRDCRSPSNCGGRCPSCIGFSFCRNLVESPCTRIGETCVGFTRCVNNFCQDNGRACNSDQDCPVFGTCGGSGFCQS